jgi:multicomponent Na+:H+ antiporter subunit F
VIHDVVFHAGSIWLTLLAASCIAMIVRERTVLVRVLLLDLLTSVIIGLLILAAATQGVPYMLDVALALAVLSFLGSLAAARFHGRGSLFR